MNGNIRIIAGRWRGRRLEVANRPGLRPTPDRVRETLFNWLQGHILGARVLDLFAGTGALGLEALSRGAASVDFLDTDAACIKRIDAALSTLSAHEQGRAQRAEAIGWLAHQATPSYDLVFIDPPYRQGLQQRALDALPAALINEASVLYVEQGHDEADLTLPAGWQMHRSQRAGQVAYHLLTRTPGSGDGE